MPTESQLQMIAANIAECVEFHPEGLSLSGLDLTEIPSEVFDLTDLECLFLRRNQITVIPDEISKLTKLKKLFLEHNQIDTIPEAIALLPNLIEIELGHNLIRSIPPSIEAALPNCEIYTFPSLIKAGENNIVDIGEVEKLKQSWLSDPCWDIEDTEGFELLRSELLSWRKEQETEMEAQKLGVSVEEYKEIRRSYRTARSQLTKVATVFCQSIDLEIDSSDSVRTTREIASNFIQEIVDDMMGAISAIVRVNEIQSSAKQRLAKPECESST